MLHDDALLAQAKRRLDVVVSHMNPHGILFLWWVNKNSPDDANVGKWLAPSSFHWVHRTQSEFLTHWPIRHTMVAEVHNAQGIPSRPEGGSIMTLDQFTLVVRRQPFQPFQMVMVDGRSFTVDHPEFVAISRRGRSVTFYAQDNTLHLLDAALIADVVTIDENGAASTDSGGDK